jgi:uncharacterized membrane protein YhaH (DUF805 family)
MDLKWTQWFLLSFKGRLSRAPFLAFNLAVTIFYLGMLFVPGRDETGSEEIAVFFMVAFLGRDCTEGV